MGYPSYQEYRFTNVPWYSDIPKGWQTIRIKFSTYVKGRVGWHGLHSDEFLLDGDHYLVTGTDFRGRKIEWNKCYRIEKNRYDEDPYIQLKDGDLLITKDGTIGKVAQVEGIPYKATLNSGVFVTRPEVGFQYDTNFMYYILTSDVFKNFVDNQKSGTTIAHLYQNVFEDFEYPFPESIEEQQKIATFLDYKTQQIDQLIEKKKALIEKLEEKRIAVITQAVTKGLDKNAKLKPSGVDWVDSIPTHWQCCPLKYFSDTFDCKHLTAEFVDEGYPLVSIAEVKGWHVDVETSKKTTFEYYKDLIDGGRKPQAGDIIYSRNATVGEAAIVLEETPDFAMGQDVCLIRSFETLLPDYLMYMLNSMLILQQLDLLMVGSTFKRINVDDIRNYTLVIPPQNEQKDIIGYLDNACMKVDNMLLKANTVVERLEEYRAALITSAVTGKIDLREADIPKDVA